jgi:hypothetical protein
MAPCVGRLRPLLAVAALAVLVALVASPAAAVPFHTPRERVLLRFGS